VYSCLPADSLANGLLVVDVNGLVCYVLVTYFWHRSVGKRVKTYTLGARICRPVYVHWCLRMDPIHHMK